jgi:hypothetical protein
MVEGRMSYDITTVSCGSETRDRLREYRDERELPNYDAALRELLDERGEITDKLCPQDSHR